MVMFVVSISESIEPREKFEAFTRYAASFLEGPHDVEVTGIRSLARQGSKNGVERRQEFALVTSDGHSLPESLARARLLESVLKTKLAADGTSNTEARVCVVEHEVVDT